MHYKEAGDKNGPLLLFLHGGGVSGWMWEKQIQYFTHCHCLVPDLPEHGLSNNADEFTIKGSAEEVIKLIEEKANGKKVILIGFSLGSQVIIQLLTARPNLIDFAMINSALTKPIPYAKTMLLPAIKLTFPLIKKRWFSKLQAKPLYITEDNFEKYYAESLQLKPDTLIRVVKENMSFNIPKDFVKATGKILVTVGEKEKAVMRKSAKDIVDANPNCVGVIIPGIGHGVSMARPDFFNLMTEKWICGDDLPKECRMIR